MYINHKDIGINIIGENLIETWISLVNSIIKNGDSTFDESRERLSIQSVRIISKNQELDNTLLKKYSNWGNVEKMISLVFDKEKMFDIDVVPSFSPGANSYHQRIKDGKMFEFVIKRLSFIPESKKAVMVFPTYKDYEQVINSPKDDYLPCLVALQFRMIETTQNNYILKTIFYMRSLDAFQKAPGNLYTMAMLSQKVAETLAENLNAVVNIGSLDGLIADAHIYKETIEDAKNTLNRASNEDNLNIGLSPII